MIEAMACGTPVIAFNHGAVPEIVRHDETGFIVETVEEAVEAIARLSAIKRAAVRATFERHFAIEVMAANYEAAYTTVLSGKRTLRRPEIAKSGKATRLAPASEIPVAGSATVRA
jgi:glycosyltransferase involved in cell wall biosynthesis